MAETVCVFQFRYFKSDVIFTVEHMVSNPDTISRCLHWMVAAKSLERIADHATNIAEDVVYLCEAQDIRHTNFKNQPPAA